MSRICFSTKLDVVFALKFCSNCCKIKYLCWDNGLLICFFPLRIMLSWIMNDSLSVQLPVFFYNPRTALSSHTYSPEWPPDSTGHRTHRSHHILVSLVLRTAAWSRESLEADCLVVSGEQSQSLWFLSRSSHSRLWRADSTKQYKTRTAIISFCSAKLLRSRVY